MRAHILNYLTIAAHKAAIILLAVCVYTHVYAAPSGGKVTSGSGTIKQAGTTTTVTQATERLGVSWQTFNVNTDETVNFVQPSASSIAVNRILGNNGSSIN